jgi:hypothetical protein
MDTDTAATMAALEPLVGNSLAILLALRENLMRAKEETAEAVSRRV